MSSIINLCFISGPTCNYIKVLTKENNQTAIYLYLSFHGRSPQTPQEKAGNLQNRDTQNVSYINTVVDLHTGIFSTRGGDLSLLQNI